MALFGKPLKKNVSSTDANARSAKRSAPSAPIDARQKRPLDASTGGITITGFGVIDWLPTRREIEVREGHGGMCAVLENAVLLYAGGHADEAKEMLARGVIEDPDAQRSQLTWLALFDLLQRTADRAAFEQLALLYVVRFECSAPAWDERVRPASGPRPSTGGYIAVSGKLTAANGAQFESLRRAMLRKH